MRIVGIDPGFGGALALLVDGDLVAVVDMPLTRYKVWSGAGKKRKLTPKRLISAAAILDVLEKWRPDQVWLEKVGPRERDGKPALWTFAQGYGAVIAACQIHGRRKLIHTVEPQLWKSTFNLNIGAAHTDDEKKSASVAAAHVLFPHRADDLPDNKDGRAEAALIAAHGAQVLEPAPEPEMM